jgi:hypothetical protein
MTPILEHPATSRVPASEVTVRNIIGYAAPYAGVAKHSAPVARAMPACASAAAVASAAALRGLRAVE